VPQRGRKRSLLELALENARLAWKNRFTLTEKEALKALQDALALPELPARIECFDISTIQGADKVGTMVSWVNGRPRRSEYRKYKIKTVEGSDDFASMREVVLRRYTRLVREDGTLPDLVLIDGGKGQLSAACAALDAAGVGDMPAASLAKKEELVYRPGRKEPLRLSRSDPALRLLQQIRDEAHRTAVGYHRDRRGKRTLATALRKVPGIGPARSRKLLIEFGSLERVKKADEAEIAAVVGPKAARAVREFLERTQ
jgi:excinuclease ABC subunit C